jgi:hypothetical protein
MDNQNQNLQDLAAALDDHQVTDDEGQVAGENETSQEAPAATETKTTEHTDAQEQKTQTSQDEPDVTEVASDETGKRYVPESRFKEVYRRQKELEPQLAQHAKPTNAVLQEIDRVAAKTQTAPSKTPDKAEQLEVEMLKSTMPQFDQESDQYDPDLDAIGSTYYNANPGITRLQAARWAINQVSRIAKKEAAARTEARTVKAIQSDQGITSRVGSRNSGTPNPDTMTLEQKEQWLKENGAW